MITKKKPAPLRDQILDFLRAHDEATLKQIAAATTERDYPSRVTTELNKLRTEAVVECEKKKGKNELWYWLATAQADQSGNAQPAVVQNTGSSASVLPSTPAEGAAVQPEPAPAATAPSTAAPVAEDEIQAGDEMPPADPTLLALANRELSDRLARVAHVLRGSGLEALKDLDDGADLQSAAATLNCAYQMALAEPAMLRGELEKARSVVELRNLLAEERAVRMALQEQLEAMQRDAMRGASLLSGDDRYTAAGYLVRAPKRPLRTFSKAEAAQAAAMAAARNGSWRGEVFALVPVGRAVRGAEWRSA